MHVACIIIASDLAIPEAERTKAACQLSPAYAIHVLLNAWLIKQFSFNPKGEMRMLTAIYPITTPTKWLIKKKDTLLLLFLVPRLLSPVLLLVFFLLSFLSIRLMSNKEKR